jgi:hypothetical protein
MQSNRWFNKIVSESPALYIVMILTYIDEILSGSIMGWFILHPSILDPIK